MVTPVQKIKQLIDIGDKIYKGANTFLFYEYLIMTVFIVLFSAVVLLVVDFYGQGVYQCRFYATISYLVGSFTSILCGFIGM